MTIVDGAALRVELIARGALHPVADRIPPSGWINKPTLRLDGLGVRSAGRAVEVGDHGRKLMRRDGRDADAVTRAEDTASRLRRDSNIEEEQTNGN